jgi:GntR family histidine utilization transcriptional repressor
VAHAPFTHGDIAFTAAGACPKEAKILGTQTGEALFVIERKTWNDTTAITSVRLAFAPGYRMQTVI